MNFVDATKAYFFKWKDFDARISRSEFWYGNLGALFVFIIIGLTQITTFEFFKSADENRGKTWKFVL